MVTPSHICPYGQKSKDLLERAGYTVEDHHLKSLKVTDAFKREHRVETPPQTFINGSRIGGYDDLRRFLGKPVADPDATGYHPVIVLFSLMALSAVAAS